MDDRPAGQHRLMITLGSGSCSLGTSDNNKCQPTCQQHCCVTGGHTAEMLSLVQHLDKSLFSPRCYVVGSTDALGVAKATATEATTQVTKCNQPSLMAGQTHDLRCMQHTYRGAPGKALWSLDEHSQTAGCLDSHVMSGQSEPYHEVEK